MAEDDASPPRNFAELKERLSGGQVRLPKRLRQVAGFVMARPDDVALGTTARIAEEAGVQPSALVRFGQALGFAGFTDMQALFRERLRNHVSNYDERMLALRTGELAKSGAGSVLDGLCTAAGKSVSGLHERTDLDLLDKAANLLAKAQTIYLIGQRRSFPVTSYMSYALGNLGVRNTLVGSAMGTDPETISFAGPGDAAIAVSFTPYAPATVEWGRNLAKAGVPLVAITDSPFSPLCADADIWLEVVEGDFRGFRSLAATMTLALTLVVTLADRRDG
ncbi:MurR/RpiR family transcriptional regulator [Aureimonas altamirensis]|uniref:MurR/RpiR family transcriptional regulator n=1 Tax=Aureimonas altamirensis TaxID=370622 RepID=UPI001E536A84|nr:MurR/RpiR family transcriptional regulator [Aureimonas altamirensis]UHD43971.1 MurR/RpiR family transcriptional regulator [Aureimonas altamirensis]